MKLHFKPSKRYAEYVRLIKCDRWVADDKAVGNDKAILRCVLNGATVAYGLHDGGNEWNGPRNFAAEVQKACGCQIVEHRGRKKSRKAIKPSGFQLTKAPSCATSGEIERLTAQHDAQRGEWVELVANPSRNAASRARDLMAEIEATETRLRALHQPVEGIIQ